MFYILFGREVSSAQGLLSALFCVQRLLLAVLQQPCDAREGSDML